MTAPKIRTSLLPNDPNTPAPLPPAMHRDITAALLQSGGAKAIEDVLAHELSASGWTTSVRTYVQMLLRSGECASFDQIMARLLKAAGLDAEPADGSAGKKEVNGDTNGAAAAAASVAPGATANQPINEMERDGSLRIPDRVVAEAVRVTRREIESVCEIDVDDM